LNEIFSLLKTFYPDEKDYALALSRLEFIDILFKKICNLAYSDGIQKKSGCISAISILIEHSPISLLKRYNLMIIESMIVIIKNMLISYSGLPNKFVTNLLLKLTRKNNFFIEQIEELKGIIELIFKNFKEVNCKGRRILEGFLDNIRKAFKKHCALPTIKTKRNMQPLQNPFPDLYKTQLESLGSTVLSQSKSYPKKLDYLLEGYSQIDNLISEVDILLHLFKHEYLSDINHESFIIYISQMIEIIEYEIEIFNDTMIGDKSSFATKYMLIEKLHISNNKLHDIYSSTKYPHRLFNLQFENKDTREKYKTKGNSRINESEYPEFYYKTYLEKSLDIQIENR